MEPDPNARQLSFVEGLWLAAIVLFIVVVLAVH